MKTLRQFLAEVEIGQRATHPTGEYEWKGAQWVHTGNKRAAKRDVSSDLHQTADEIDHTVKPSSSGTYHHIVDVHYSKPGSSEISSNKIDLEGPHGNTSQGRNIALGAARKHYENQGYQVHKTIHGGVTDSYEPPKAPGNATRKEPEKPKDINKDHPEINHQEPESNGQESNGPKAPEPIKSTEAGETESKQYNSHVWDKRRDRKSAGTKQFKNRNVENAKETVGQVADLLVTGHARNESFIEKKTLRQFINLKNK